MSNQLDDIFTAVADPARRAILAHLAHGLHEVNDIAQAMQLPRDVVSRHLRVLEQAGLLMRYRQGRGTACRLVAEPLRDASDWLAQYRHFWEHNF